VAKRRNSEDVSGATFADLYDVHEEMKSKGQKPMGRPRKKVQRKPYTIYLTKEEATMLRRLELLMNDYMSINRSEIVGVAVELLAEIIQTEESGDFKAIRNVDGVKRRLKNQVLG
jgi:hypothetical protein